VLSSSETVQHPVRLGGVGRFAENSAVEHDHRVRCQDELTRPGDCLRLGPGQALHVLFRQLVDENALVEVGRPHFESEVEAFQ
jgi:hypothetical protein